MSSYGAMGDSKPMGEAERLLDNSMQTNEATEEMGHATLDRMREQREQLASAAATAQDTQRVTADAKGTLRDLAFKIVKEKVFLVLVIVFMLGVDGGLAYLLVQNNGKFTSKR